MQIEEMTREELLEVVRRLPRMADGVPVVPGMKLCAILNYGGDNPIMYEIDSAHGWSRGGDGQLYVTDKDGSSSAPLRDCFSTREAAETAGKDKPCDT